MLYLKFYSAIRYIALLANTSCNQLNYCLIIQEAWDNMQIVGSCLMPCCKVV